MKLLPALLAFFAVTVSLAAGEPIAIGSRRELMIDDHLFDSMTGSLRLQVQ